MARGSCSWRSRRQASWLTFGARPELTDPGRAPVRKVHDGRADGRTDTACEYDPLFAVAAVADRRWLIPVVGRSKPFHCALRTRPGRDLSND
jgi:hypothetical protein